MVQGWNFNGRDRTPRNWPDTEKNTSQNSIAPRYVKLNISIKTEDRAFALKIYKQVFYKIIDQKEIFLQKTENNRTKKMPFWKRITYHTVSI